MAKVTGALKTVLSNPSQVTGVWIRSGEDRPDGDGVVLNELDKVPITGGVVSFTAVPGPAVLVLERAGGRPTNLKIMVGTGDSSLADAVNAADVASHLDSYRLGQLVGMVETTQQNASDASAAAARAEAAAVRLDTTVGTRVFAGDTMIYGDTGWRDVTALFSDLIESGTLRFRRVGGVVHVEAAWLKFKAEGTTELFLPQGFIPSRATALPLYSSSAQPTPASIFRVAFTGRVSIYVLDDRFSGNDTGIIYTEDAWPTTLPGTPA